jgi:hypothetical protein
VLQRAAVELHLVRDPIDDDAVLSFVVERRRREHGQLRGDAVAGAELVHPRDERWRKAVFTSDEQSDLHSFLS